jgi:hypothetical protein
MPDYDSPWKEMLDSYFPAFMAFFFPEAHADIDWTRGYESLDTDLQQIVRDVALGTRLADKLMQVWRRDGVEQMVLVHTEIQGNREADFARRMYVYNYRLFDRYDRPVVRLAVLGAPARPGGRRAMSSACGVVVSASHFRWSNCGTMRRAGTPWRPVTIRLPPSSWPICKHGRRAATPVNIGKRLRKEEGHEGRKIAVEHLFPGAVVVCHQYKSWDGYSLLGPAPRATPVQRTV